MMNISEFERTKPVETLRCINDKIDHYNEILNRYRDNNGNYHIMDEEDVVGVTCYRQFLEDLQQIKKIFLIGK